MRLDNLFGGILDALTGGEHTSQNRRDDDVEPASRDPFGDPGDLAKQDIRPSSEDPYGDPADESEREAVLPSSRDPYGDPADRR